MDILLNKDIVVKFLSKNISDKDLVKQVKRILENENSVFLYSSKYLSFIKNELIENFEDEYQDFLKFISDNGYSIKSSLSNSYEDEFFNLYTNSKNKVMATFLYEKDEILLKSIQNLVILSQQKKPNYDWLVTQLAILHPNPIVVDCHDFLDNNSVVVFFEDLFRIPKSISEINIFDRQTSTFLHNLFDKIINRYFIKYYTLEHKNFSSDVKSIKNFFRKVKIFITKISKVTHGRRIVFENITIISDNDFNNLTYSEPWEISIRYSKKIANNWLSFCSKYTELR
jgi:hypothetical protein